jgi:aryl carrier-like protein
MAECGEHTAEGNTVALAMAAATLSAWQKVLEATVARPNRLN